MKFAKLTVVIILLAVISGCTGFTNMVKNDALISQLAVEAATARVLHDHPRWKTATIRITGGAMSLIDGKMQADLASVEGYVKDQVDWSRMMPEEQALVSVLISQVVQNLKDSFRAENIVKPEEQMIYVRQVLKWINNAAKRQSDLNWTIWERQIDTAIESAAVRADDNSRIEEFKAQLRIDLNAGRLAFKNFHSAAL